MKRDQNAPDARLTEKARATVLEARKDEGRLWFCPGETPFKIAKIIVWFFGGALCILLAAFLMGLLLEQGDRSPGGEGYARLVSDIRVTAVCLAVVVAGIIVCMLKQYAVGGALFVIEAVLFLPRQNWQIGMLALEGGWRPLIYSLPTVLLAIAGLYLLICEIAERVRIKKMKDDFLRRIAAAHPAQEGELTTAEAWSSYIEEFLSEPVHARPKRSLKKKKQKKDQKEEV